MIGTASNLVASRSNRSMLQPVLWFVYPLLFEDNGKWVPFLVEKPFWEAAFQQLDSRTEFQPQPLGLFWEVE